MSRIGKLPITLPKGVEVNVSDKNVVTVKGAKGTLTQKMDSAVTLKNVESNIRACYGSKTSQSNARFIPRFGSFHG